MKVALLELFILKHEIDSKSEFQILVVVNCRYDLIQLASDLLWPVKAAGYLSFVRIEQRQLQKYTVNP